MASYTETVNPFAALGLPPSASKAAVTAKYRALILVHHPDKQHRSSPEHCHARLELTKLLNWARSECIREIKAFEWRHAYYHGQNATNRTPFRASPPSAPRSQTHRPRAHGPSHTVGSPASTTVPKRSCRWPNRSPNDRQTSPLYLLLTVLALVILHTAQVAEWRAPWAAGLPNTDETAYEYYFKCLTIHEENEATSQARVTIISYERDRTADQWKKFDEEIKENGQLVYQYRNDTRSGPAKPHPPRAVDFRATKQVASTIFRLRGDPAWKMVKTVTKTAEAMETPLGRVSERTTRFFYHGTLVKEALSSHEV